MRKSLFVAAWTALFAVPASAVTIVWVPIGNPGNPGDAPVPTKCYVPDCGSVAYDYRISRYETTNAQYAEFLNAVDVEGNNTLELYNASMDTDPTFGGISRVPGNAPGSRYVVKPGFEDQPVTYVSFYDALRFANWMSNGQGSGDTETGAYTLLGGTANPSNGLTVARNAGANVFLTSENEWYKAAYYSPGGVYFDYPTGTDAVTVCVAPDADTGNSANCASGALTTAGAYGLSESPYGTFDQGGNLWEWTEQIVSGTFAAPRGGNWEDGAGYLAASSSGYDGVNSERDDYGFRVASLVPEPAQALLVLTGGLVMAAARRQRRA